MTGRQAAPGGKGVFSRADLLWGFFAVDESQHLDLAELLGFEETATLDPDQERISQPTSDDVAVPRLDLGPPNEPRSQESTATSSSYYRIVGRQLTETRPGTDTQELALPDWFTQASPTILEETDTRIPPIHRVVPLHTPLAPWPRLLPLLQRVLGDRIGGIQPDIPVLVRQVARRSFIRRIPRRRRLRWAETARLLIDINDGNFPYRRDFIHLRERLRDVRGEEGLEVQYVRDEPGGYIARYQYGREVLEPWQAPARGTPILILSDLGMQSGSRRDLYAWLVFGQLLNAQGFRPTVLMPAAERDIDKRLLKFFDCILWDRNSRLKRVQGTYQAEQDKQDHPRSVDRLLGYFFAAVRVDAGLLRAVRHLLSAGHCDIGHEVAVWRHPAVNKEGDEWGWQASSKPGYLDEAQEQLRSLPRLQQDRLVALIGRYHALYPDELHFEAMYGLMMLGLPVPEQVRVATKSFMQDMVATYARHPEDTLLDAWVKRHLARHQDPENRKHHRYWLPLLAFARVHEAGRKGTAEIEMPEDLSPEEKAEILRFASHARQPDTYVLRQSGEVLELVPEQAVAHSSQADDWERDARMGANLLILRLQDTHIFHSHRDDKGQRRDVMLDLATPGKQSFRFPATGRHEFQIGRERLLVEVKAAQQLMEPWMRRIEAGGRGLRAESRSGGEYYWHPPEWPPEHGMLPGFWHYLPRGEGIVPPDWATAAVRDGYGLYVDLTIAGITQRFRWIEPTSFQMGSPVDEDGRYDDETQHEVLLTQGYWLADTACTQGLWQAVMGENPSRLKGENNPVENVSWDDVDKFLERLHEQYPELNLRFPTEAEWENACRAGTTGAFHFGGELSVAKVNYRGTWEYGSGEWGKGAVKKTAPVKSYPPNVWGLYEMHGNVWEWCQDRYGDYPAGPVSDPQGAESGARRVLRGGSWIDSGRGCRSACRAPRAPAARGFIGGGFRLARGL